MAADKGKKCKIERGEDEEADQIDEKLVLCIEKLQEVQDELEKVNEEASDKVLEVEQKYNEIRRPVYVKRTDIIKGIPHFWLTAFNSHPAIDGILTEEDQKIFKYLDSIDVEDFKDVKSGYSITFHFNPNPFFEETKLTKTCSFSDEGLTKITGTQALKAFKSSINPATIPSYSCLAAWDFSLDPCSLPHRTHFVCGITCSTDSTRVTSLVVDPVGYSGPLTPLLSTLSELTHLDLSDNNFYGSVPASLSSLTKLETLTLRSNSLSGSVPPSLAKLTSLKTFEISHNALTGSLPDTFSSLTNLQVLDFSYNKLTGVLPKLPPNLVTLALKSNSLTGSLSQTSFQGLNKLQIVELSDNMLSGVLQGWLFLLPSVQQVDLANNSFTRVEIWKPRGSKTSLVSVDLGWNKIEGDLPVDLVLFSSLSVLILRNNQLQGPIPWRYGNRKSLRRLFLEGNFLNGGVPASFLSNNNELSGSFGDNCLQSCPVSSGLCSTSQKPNRICKQFYHQRPRLEI